ncbi:MAG: NAD kinase [Actinomycetes bacterium]
MTNLPRVLVIIHNNSVEAENVAAKVCKQLQNKKIEIFAPSEDAKVLEKNDVKVKIFESSKEDSANLALVFGGDGTILRAVEVSRDKKIPILGINLGHVGFLAEAELEHLEDVVKSITEHSWIEEDRLALEVAVFKDNNKVFSTFALNDVAIEKSEPGHMFDVILEIDSQPVSRLSGDGIICATPTGSTAYAFSAGGPVVWPSVEAICVVPISAHALFAKPLVVSTHSKIAIEIPANGTNGHLTADGRRSFDLFPGMRIEITKSKDYVHLARMEDKSFSQTLVKKFQLPVEGWRGNTKRK